MRLPITRAVQSLLITCALFAFNGIASAQTSSTMPTVTITPFVPKADAVLQVVPDRSDWTYKLGDKANFHISFNVKPYPVAGIPIKYKLGLVMIDETDKDAVVPESGLDLPVTSTSEPNFIRCIVSATVNGKPVTELATIGFSPEKIVPTQTEPADFDAFWAKQKTILAAIAPDYQLTPAPQLSTDKLEVSYLSFLVSGNSYNIPTRIFGVLAVPRGAGPYPAVMNPPGAGVRPYTGALELAEKGVITLQIGIHGIPVNLPKEVYDLLDGGALRGYSGFNLDNRDQYYYRRVYLGALRASEYLMTHPKWDGKNLITMGGSQGGQLSIVTAALNPRVTAVAANYPAYSDVSGYLYGRAGGWPGMFRLSADGKKRAGEPIEAKLLTTGYYDTVNFAKRVKVPGYYFFGYNDLLTPPTSTFSVYNVITAKKQLLIPPQHGHWTPPNIQAQIDAWILEQAASKK